MSSPTGSMLGPGLEHGTLTFLKLGGSDGNEFLDDLNQEYMSVAAHDRVYVVDMDHW